MTSATLNSLRSYESLKAEATRRGIDWRPPEQRQSDFARYRADPVAFAQEVLHVKPWERQLEIMMAVAQHERVAVRSCQDSGKSWAIAALVIWRTYCFTPSLTITTATTERQVKGILWLEIGRMHRSAGLPGRLLGQELYVSPTQRAFGFTTNTPERFQGWHEEHIMGVVDEASGVPNPIYEAMEGMMTSNDPKLVLIGNPNNASGTFYDAFSSPLYQKFKINAYEVPAFLMRPGWPQQMLEQWGEDNPAYQVRVLGEFPEQGDDSLISMKWVVAAREREMAPSGPLQIGVDIARQGSDESVAYVWRDGCVQRGEYWRGNDLMQSTGRIVSLIREANPVAVKIDDCGVGGGVTDRLHELRREKEIPIPPTPINVGEAAFDKVRFYNRRSEIFWDLRERFRTGEISIPADDDILMSQLVALKYTFTSRGQIKLESKEDMAKRRGTTHGWASPDRADALALTGAAGRPWALPGASAGPSKGMSGSPLASMGIGGTR